MISRGARLATGRRILARQVYRKATMSCIGRVAGLVAMGAAVVASGCVKDGAAVDIGDLSGKSLTVTHDSVASSGLKVAFDYDDFSRCNVLGSDAFARLNGQSVPLFRGEYEYFPPMGDDGGFNCFHPSVTLERIPVDLSPPWTIEIGDSSEIVSVTFGPGTPNSFDVGPLDNVTLTSSSDNLNVPIHRRPGQATAAHAEATFTASDGQSSVRLGDVYSSYIQILNPVDPGWPSGPVTVRIDVYYYPVDALLDCQNARCAIDVDSAFVGHCVVGTGSARSCSSLNTVLETTVLTVPLSCPTASGLCS
jgi:hypothetical protein